ncbi:hypothetical protein [Arthrobacter methylotrophus]|uniref:hypothetical protein n=1 Tax=Arthrobacter methylotrophus TaxID=121291 RepID=UPI0031E8B5FA
MRYPRSMDGLHRLQPAHSHEHVQRRNVAVVLHPGCGRGLGIDQRVGSDLRAFRDDSTRLWCLLTRFPDRT